MSSKKTVSILITHPIAAKMWHPTKNPDYDIEDITFGSEKMVWWFYPYDDPKTGKHFDFEWEQQVCSLVKTEIPDVLFGDLNEVRLKIYATSNLGTGLTRVEGSTEYATFEDAVNAIDALNLSQAHYTIELLSDVEIGNANNDGKYSALVLPLKAASLAINGRGHKMTFAGNITLKCNTVLERVEMLPVKVVTGGYEPVKANIVMSTFSLQLSDSLIGYPYKEADPYGGADIEKKQWLIGNITGSINSSRLLIYTDRESIDFAADNISNVNTVRLCGNESGRYGYYEMNIKVSGNTTIGTLIFNRNATYTAGGNLNVGNIEIMRMDGDFVPSGPAVNAVIKKTASKILRVDGTVTRGTTDTLELDVLPDNYELLPSGTRLIVGSANLDNTQWIVKVGERDYTSSITYREYNTYKAGNDMMLGAKK